MYTNIQVYMYIQAHLSTKVPCIESDTSQLFGSFLLLLDVLCLEVFTILPYTQVNSNSRQRSCMVKGGTANVLVSRAQQAHVHANPNKHVTLYIALVTCTCTCTSMSYWPVLFPLAFTGGVSSPVTLWRKVVVGVTFSWTSQRRDKMVVLPIFWNPTIISFMLSFCLALQTKKEEVNYFQQSNDTQ